MPSNHVDRGREALAVFRADISDENPHADIEAFDDMIEALEGLDSIMADDEDVLIDDHVDYHSANGMLRIELIGRTIVIDAFSAETTIEADDDGVVIRDAVGGVVTLRPGSF